MSSMTINADTHLQNKHTAHNEERQIQRVWSHLLHISQCGSVHGKTNKSQKSTAADFPGTGRGSWCRGRREVDVEAGRLGARDGKSGTRACSM